ncbi:collagen-binding MSCRAMM Scm [Enterococcus mundtii QU 25]|uniref:collagen-binding protein n=1 Tax=Enterococcus mundtii TaxID=53346 RepID=UPI0003C530A5|nr:collagen-binding protein [Enterococcus mundtii]BAO07680.1 collagen-binding MSCRAMM Scm [Enterococcus mundtii QU 25]
MFKNKVVNLSLMSVLLLHLFFPIQVIAETFLPQDPGSVYDDLTGDYGVLGIASQFHVFAKEKTTINAHTEGNVATSVLSATNNFGTSISTGDLNKEINYAQSVETIISSAETAASVKRSNKFIVGPNNVITTENDKIIVNGTRLDHLSVDEFYQDREDAQYIDFNKEFENLMLTSNMLMSLDPLKTYTPDDFPDMNNRVIDCTDLVGDQPYVINVAASVLAKNTPLRINNPEGKVLIINVVDAPTNFSVQSQIQYNKRSNHQTEDFSDANISWNFGNLTEKLEINAPFQGTIIAPCADITVNQSQDGTIIGKNVILNATTNRWDPNEIFAVPNTHDDTTDTTSSSTEPSTSESSTEPSTSESSTEPSTSESSTEPSTSESSTEPSTSESSTEPSTSESSTEPSTSESSTEPSTSESSTEPSTSESSTEPSTSESSTEPSTSESSTYPGKNGKQSDTSTTTSSASSVSSTNESDEPVISGEGTVESDGSGTMQMNDRRENKVALAVESNTNNDDPSTKNVQSQNQQLFPQTNGERNNLWIMVGAVLVYVVTLLFYRRKQV